LRKAAILKYIADSTTIALRIRMDDIIGFDDP